MVDKKTIGISSLIAIFIVSASMIVPSFFDIPKYYCESRPEIGIVECDSFSKYIAENGKCIRDENTNLICREGWKLVVDDTEIPEEIEQPLIIPSPEGSKWECSPEGCIEII